jgi:hypothetical protein
MQWDSLLDTINEECILLLKLTKGSHKLIVATNLLANYGCGRIMSSTEGCTFGSATFYVVYARWSSSPCYV